MCACITKMPKLLAFCPLWKAWVGGSLWGGRRGECCRGLAEVQGQRADERGFTIRQDCILFIFSRACLSAQGSGTRTETMNAGGFVFCELAELGSTCSWLPGACSSRSPEPSTSHPSTWTQILARPRLWDVWSGSSKEHAKRDRKWKEVAKELRHVL